MKLNIIALITILSSWVINSHGQELPLSKKNLNILFAESISKHPHYPNGSSRHEWEICGADSCISTLDTVRILNNSSGVVEQNCYTYTTWEFYRRHSFKRYDEIYYGYAGSRAYKVGNLFHVKLKKVNNKLHLKVFKSGLLVYDFIVVRIEFIALAPYNKCALITAINSITPH